MNLLQKLYKASRQTDRPLVFSKEQAAAFVNKHAYITSHSFHKEVGSNTYVRYVFFNTDHLFAYDRETKTKVLDSVPTTTYMPTKVVPRPGVEDGVIADFETYLNVFESESNVIYSLNELLDLFGCKPNGDLKT